MRKYIGGVVFIFICASFAWIILGSVTSLRTHEQDMKLRTAVGKLWGTVQRQYAPQVYFQTTYERKVTKVVDSKKTVESYTETVKNPMIFDGSEIDVNLKLEHRRKGLLWYSIYKVRFHGKYSITNNSKEIQHFIFDYKFPTADGIYDNFAFAVDGQKLEKIEPVAGTIMTTLHFDPNKTRIVEVSYETQGMDEWWYILGDGVSHIRNFKLIMSTDFDKVDFSENTIAPTEKAKIDHGWQLVWRYSDLISGVQIGLVMPQKLNPGPFVSKVTYFAPVSLFLFLFLMFIITALNEIKVHPMNYFFIAAAFFSFHLLLSYLADHLDINLALVIASVVSIFLVISYMRLVVGVRFAFLETGLSQFVYLVIFSYTFFLEGYTGLAITVLCIITLFIVMQLTGRVDWEKQFAKDK